MGVLIHIMQIRTIFVRPVQLDSVMDGVRRMNDTEWKKPMRDRKLTAPGIETDRDLDCSECGARINAVREPFLVISGGITGNFLHRLCVICTYNRYEKIVYENILAHKKTIEDIRVYVESRRPKKPH